MAEAFARILGGDAVIAASAGSRPSGKVNPKAIAAMAELGYDLSTHTSTGLDAIADGTWDAVVTMGCGDECPFVPARVREDWQIPDPRELEGDDFRAVRDRVRAEVRGLLERLSPTRPDP